MMKRTCQLAAALLGLLLAACASSPPTLVALPSYPGAMRPLNDNSRATLSLRPVTLPGYLDTYAVVLDRKANALRVAEGSEWAERLPDAVTRTLRDALSQRLGSSGVLLRGEHRVADAELAIEFLRLDPSDGAMELDARWSFVCSARGLPVRAGRTQLRTPLEAGTTSAVAAATANALAQFADVLASQTWCDKGS
jgi:uncharacterized lipoprotein YmbA